MTMIVNITKEESIRWINHAIAFYENLGKKQKEMADDFGLPPSRLSELKNPKLPTKVTKSQIEQIIKLCGSPRRDPGRFEHAELYDSLDTFFESFIPVSLNRFHRAVYKSLSNQATVDHILEECNFEVSSLDNQIDNINQFVRSDGFSLLCLDETFNEKVRSPTTEYLLSLIKPYGINNISTEAFYRLRQLNSLIKELPDFVLGGESKNGLSPTIPRTQIVLTGKRIAAFLPPERIFKYPVNKQISDELNTLSGGCLPYFSQKSQIPELDSWRSIRVEVYLSEDMNYHLLIHLSHGEMSPVDSSYESTIPEGFSWCNYDAVVLKKDRIAVIKNVSSLDLFEQIEELRKWQGLGEDNLYELKQNIAKAGGHVAGAVVLS